MILIFFAILLNYFSSGASPKTIYTIKQLFSMEKKRQTDFAAGDKVVYLPDKRIYDFGYISQTGHAVIYEEGECNMQDATAVDPSKLVKLVSD